MTEAAEQLQNGVTVEELTKNMTSFAYYREAYGAVLDGMVGLYEIEIPKSEAPAFALADAQIQEGIRLPILPTQRHHHQQQQQQQQPQLVQTQSTQPVKLHQKLQPHPTHKLLSKPQPPLSPIPTLSPDSLR